MASLRGQGKFNLILLLHILPFSTGILIHHVDSSFSLGQFKTKNVEDCHTFLRNNTCLSLLKPSDRSGTVVNVLRYNSEGCRFDPKWCYWNFSLKKSSRSHYGSGVDSASNRNEYQENFLGVNAAGT